MNEIREKNIALYLIDPQIRSSVLSHFSDWMFQKDIYRLFFTVISNQSFNERELNAQVVKTGLQELNHSLSKFDITLIDELFNSFSGITENDRKYVIKLISDFIKERLYWRGTDLMARNKLEEAEPLLCKAVNFSIEGKKFTNLSDQSYILELFENKFPKDGKYIKSTLSLINKNSLFKGYRRSDLVQICAPPKAGKCLGIDTEILMFDGTIKKVQDIIVGDKLMGPDSKPRTVESLARGREQMYWVRQNKAMDYRVNESHILSLKSGEEVFNYSVLDYLSLSEEQQRRKRGYKASVEFKGNTKKLPIDPWFLGFWLSSGCRSSSILISTGKNDIDLVNKITTIGYSLKKVENLDTRKSSQYYVPNIKEKFSKLKVTEKKHIPLVYLTSNKANRLELLAGILDGKGDLHCDMEFDLVEKSDQLALDICQLCNSLGFRVTKTKTKDQKYRIKISGNLSTIPTTIKKKQSNLVSKRNPLTTGIKVEKDIVDDYYGFTLKEDPLFLLADCTVTHNTTLMVQESAAFSCQGYHVVFASIGDNEQDDIAMKICSYSTKTPMDVVIQNFAQELEKNKEILKNVSAESYPSGSVAIGELLADCRRVHLTRPIDVLIVDYDANIMQPTDNMYESGGVIYSALKGFGQMNNCVVIVGSQPVKSAWRDEIMGSDAANESSKKQMHVDMMITIGKNQSCPYLGTINIPLMRRGMGNVISRVRFNFETAEIIELSQEQYDEALNNYEGTGNKGNGKQKFSPVSLEDE